MKENQEITLIKDLSLLRIGVNDITMSTNLGVHEIYMLKKQTPISLPPPDKTGDKRHMFSKSLQKYLELSYTDELTAYEDHPCDVLHIILDIDGIYEYLEIVVETLFEVSTLPQIPGYQPYIDFLTHLLDLDHSVKPPTHLAEDEFHQGHQELYPYAIPSTREMLLGILRKRICSRMRKGIQRGFPIIYGNFGKNIAQSMLLLKTFLKGIEQY